MPDWSWIQSVLAWKDLVPDLVWAVAGAAIGFFANNRIAPRWKEIRKIEVQIERMPDLTKKVEEVKSDIGMLRDEITSVRTRGNEALWNFFEDCNILLNDFFAFPLFSGLPMQGDVNEYRQSLEQLLTNIRLSKMRLMVYFHGNDVLVEQANKVALACNELRTTFHQLYPSIAFAHTVYKDANEEQVEEAQQNMSEKSREYDEAIKVSLQGVHCAFNKYISSMNAYFSSKNQRS